MIYFIKTFQDTLLELKKQLLLNELDKYSKLDPVQPSTSGSQINNQVKSKEFDLNDIVGNNAYKSYF